MTTELTEAIDRANLKEWSHSFAVTKASQETVAKLIEGGNPVYKTKGDSLLFGYTRPLTGVAFSSLSKDQALDWFDITENEDVPSTDESGSCEIYEVSMYQADKLCDIASGVQVAMDSDVEWLQEAGLVTVTDAGNIKATSVGRQWASMMMPTKKAGS